MDSLRLNAIKRCSNEDALNDMFKDFGISSDEEKVSALIEAMGNPETFYSCGIPSADKQCEALIGAFLSGVWKPDAV
jgi:uncharacterized ParB-like nuclease family protein